MAPPAILTNIALYWCRLMNTQIVKVEKKSF